MLPESIALGRLLPTCAFVHMLAVDEGLAATVVALPATIRRAVPKRRAEFIAGRLCASAALHAAGAPVEHEITISALGAPRWPDGFVGSITHSAGLAAAAAASSRQLRALGIDVERIVPADAIESLAPAVARADEIQRVSDDGADAATAFTIVFSAKEALFKCLAPLVGRYFDFLDVEVGSVANGALSLRLRTSLSYELRDGSALAVRFARVGQMVLTATFLSAGDHIASRA